LNIDFEVNFEIDFLVSRRDEVIGHKRDRKEHKKKANSSNFL
jgi:hypothetical protein